MINDKRESLMGTGMIESDGHIYPNKSIRMPDPRISPNSRTENRELPITELR